MKYEITKEQILETIRTGTDVTERYFKEIIPEAFKTKLDTGKWYKSSTDIEFLVYYQSNGNDNYGFWQDQPYRDNISFGDYWYNMSRLATPEEVESALINEAKKREYKKGNFKCMFNREDEFNLDYKKWFYCDIEKSLFTMPYGEGGSCLFKDGKWAEILPQEKTVVPMEKALKIIAKKMKVSPENIEIQY